MNTYKEKYRGFTDEQLIAMIISRKDYLPEAMDAAAELLAERAIPETDMILMAGQVREINQIALRRENEPLPIHFKVLLVVFPVLGMGGTRVVGIVGLLVLQVMLHEEGRHQLRADIFKYTVFGTLGWMLLIYLF